MKLSDIMGQMGLSSYAEIALILFLITFLAICLKVFVFSSKQEHEDAANIPLRDHPPDRHSPRTGSSHTGSSHTSSSHTGSPHTSENS